MHTIHLQAESATNNGDGTFTLQLRTRDLTDAEIRTLRSLFPHCDSELSAMFAKEALLQALVPDSEMRPVDTQDQVPILPNSRKKGPVPSSKVSKLTPNTNTIGAQTYPDPEDDDLPL